MRGIYLGLGSNLGDREKYLRDALMFLQEREIKLLKCSSIEETKPLGAKRQPDYLNMVCEISTDLKPLELLKVCQEIEDALGRERGEKWGSRTIDIDILIFGDLKMSTPQLVIPHIEIGNRDFVRKQLLECGYEGGWQGLQESNPH